MQESKQKVTKFVSPERMTENVLSVPTSLNIPLISAGHIRATRFVTYMTSKGQDPLAELCRIA